MTERSQVISAVGGINHASNRTRIGQTDGHRLWEPVGETGIHHIGYWSDDVAAELVRHGYVTEGHPGR
ncbi:hypothetical protein [Nocardia anaemiae]|uniref:hypothetical protein n=1 Tax=Nocardia anaemiae TaxID=263910 RepID=UPI0007A39FBB|nr:hypothetical protein [Nocardia anaemiae]